MRFSSIMTRKKPLLLIMAAVVLLGAAVLCIHLFLGGQAVKMRAERLSAASGGLTQYDLSLILRPEENTVALTENVTYTNCSQEVMQEVVLRLWPNAFADEQTSPASVSEWADQCYGDAFSAGGVLLNGVWVNDVLTETAYADDAKTVLSVPVTLQPGETVALRLRVTVQIPVCDYRFGRTGNTFLLTSFVPVIPVFENGAWHTEAYDAIGEPFVQEAANFSFRLSVPDDWQVYANAELTKNGTLWTGTALAARDLSLIVTKESVVRTGEINGIRVTALAADAKTASRALELAKKALKTYSDLYGNYPYPVFLLSACPLPFDSAELSGLSLLDQSLFSNDEKAEQAVALSCARQWFGGIVGVDLYNQGWMSGALSRYAMLSYYEVNAGAAAKEDLERTLVDAAMQERLNGTYTPGMPVDYFADLTTYISVVYDKGCALISALNLSLSGGANGFLRAYVEKYAFSTVSRAGFERFLNEYAGYDLRPLVVDYLDTLMR